MDWHKLIRHFKPLEAGDIPAFASPSDMIRALSTYNRAINNILSHNNDVALISLRKLAASYPEFTLPGLLTGLLLASEGNTELASRHIHRAVDIGLEPAWQDLANHAIAELENRPETTADQPDSMGSASAVNTALPPVIGATPVLEKTGRRGKVRMASTRERENVVRRGEFQQDEETNVKMGREPIEYLRFALPALAILIITGFLVFFGIRMVSGISETGRQQREANARLEWLVTKLESLAGQNALIGQLLEDYESNFAETTEPTSATQTPSMPTTSMSTEPAPEPTPVQTTAAATTNTPTATTIATTQPVEQQLLIRADEFYRQAITTADRDVRQAGDLLLQARSLLQDIPSGTVAPEVESDSDDLRLAVETLIGEIARNAAEANRLLGMDRFNSEDYGNALEYFLAGFALDPRAYGGGVAYYCGLSYQMMGDREAARPYYEYVIRQFSNRDIAEYARSRLRQMGY